MIQEIVDEAVINSNHENTDGGMEILCNILVLEGTGAYGPLLLAPAEGLGGPSGPLSCGGIYFNN